MSFSVGLHLQEKGGSTYDLIQQHKGIGKIQFESLYEGRVCEICHIAVCSIVFENREPSSYIWFQLTMDSTCSWAAGSYTGYWTMEKLNTSFLEQPDISIGWGYKCPSPVHGGRVALMCTSCLFHSVPLRGSSSSPQRQQAQHHNPTGCSSQSRPSLNL